MQVIHIIDCLGGSGGVNSFVYDLSEKQVAEGLKVTIIGLLQESWSKIDTIVPPHGVNVWKLGAKSRSDAILQSFRLRAYINKIAKEDVTICNLHLKLSVLVGSISTIGIANVRCVETYHSQYSHYWLENKLMSFFVKKYICCSVSAFEEMRRRFHSPINKLEMVSNGIEIRKVRMEALKGEAGKKYDIQIVSVGRLTTQKNFHITAKAFSRIPGNICYRIIGDGDQKEKIEQECNNSPKVELTGVMTRVNVLAELLQADMVVMPSLWEGLSILQLESIALGCPMMLSNISSLRDVFNEPPLDANEPWRVCSWGYLVDTNNDIAYTEAMIHYINHRELRDSMRKQVLVMSERYDIANTASGYLDVYKSIAGEKRTSRGD